MKEMGPWRSGRVGKMWGCEGHAYRVRIWGHKATELQR